MKWNKPESAPKDRAFLGDFGFPWLQSAIWCPASNKWSVANLQASEHVYGRDYWWETEFENEADLRRWTEMPELYKKTQNDD